MKILHSRWGRCCLPLTLLAASYLPLATQARVIDNFTGGQYFTVCRTCAGASNPNHPLWDSGQNLAASTEIVGGHRDVWTAIDQQGSIVGKDPDRVSNISVSAHKLVWSAETSVVSSLVLYWDGADLVPDGSGTGANPRPLVPNLATTGGFAPVDLTDGGGSTQFNLYIGTTDRPFNIKLTVYDKDAGVLTYSGSFTGPYFAETTWEIPMTVFAKGQGGAKPEDFKHVTAITLEIDQPVGSIDVEFAGFETFGAPAIHIEKYTNCLDGDGLDGQPRSATSACTSLEDTADVAQIQPGQTVKWTYFVTNTGGSPFDRADVVVTDDHLADHGAPAPVLSESSDVGSDDILSPGESWVFTSSTTAVELRLVDNSSPLFPDIKLGCGVVGPNGDDRRPTYENTGVVTIQGTSLTDSDPSHYCNPEGPAIDIEKYTNCKNSDAKDGSAAGNATSGCAALQETGDISQIAAGDQVKWTYIVTNTGNVTFYFQEVQVTDDQLATAGATSDAAGNAPTSDPVFVQVVSGDANNDGQATMSPGEKWAYVAYAKAKELRLVPSDSGLTIVDGCTQDPANQRPTYENFGVVSALGATDSDASHYCNPEGPAITIKKYTNCLDADQAVWPGVAAPTSDCSNLQAPANVPEIAVNDQVKWTYVVKNVGDVSFYYDEVAVTDGQLDNHPGVNPPASGFAPVFIPESDVNNDGILSPQEEWWYQALAPAVNITAEKLAGNPSQLMIVPGCRDTSGQTDTFRDAYENTGLVVVDAFGLRDDDPSHYCNPSDPKVTIVKYTNGADANDPNAAGVPSIAPGAPVTWTYMVTNKGNVAVPAAQVAVTDNTTGVTPTFTSVFTGNADAMFDPGEVWLYTATGTALDLALPPPPGVTTVPGSCTAGGAQPPRTAYTNVGTVTIPGASKSDTSSYCNPLTAIGDFVWNDANANGQQDDGANSGLAGSMVTLWQCGPDGDSGTADDVNTGQSMVTPATGVYGFGNLAPGCYFVKFTTPAGYTPTTANSGNDATDSDAVAGVTGPYNLAAGVPNLTVDAGFYKPSAPCIVNTFLLEGNSATSGTAGNIRTFKGGSVNVKASAWSQSSTSYSAAYLGSYSGGLGVTDSSEGTGGNNSHTLDNSGQKNYILFEFDSEVTIDKATLGYVVGDSDIEVWIGTTNDPYSNHQTLNAALLNSLSYTEVNNGGSSSRTADINAGLVSGNVLVIATKLADSDDFVKVKSLVTYCPTPVGALTLACPSNSAGTVGQSYSTSLVRSGGVSPFTFSIQTGSLPGGLTLNTATGAITGTPTAAGPFNFTAKVVDATTGTAQSATATCSITVVKPQCVDSVISFTGSSSTSGTAGNVRTFNFTGLTAKVSAWSRTKGTSGTWAKAFLGAYSGGLGVTDGSEGSGGNDTHKVDNVGRDNYVVFQFSTPVVVDQAFLDYVGDDSDTQVWIGTKDYATIQTLSDGLLNGLPVKEVNNTTSADSRWANVNAGGVAGNILVVAASTLDSTPDDRFKVRKLDICK